jgi:hypothetical protein
VLRTTCASLLVTKIFVTLYALGSFYTYIIPDIDDMAKSIDRIDWKYLFTILIQCRYAREYYRSKIEIDIPEADEWVERIGKTAYEMCNNNRIMLKTSDSNKCTGLIIESNDSALVGY